MTRARPGSKWSIDGQVHALARVPAGGKCSGMICACMSTIIYWLLFERRLCRRNRILCTVASRDRWGESGGERRRLYLESGVADRLAGGWRTDRGGVRVATLHPPESPNSCQGQGARIDKLGRKERR